MIRNRVFLAVVAVTGLIQVQAASAASPVVIINQNQTNQCIVTPTGSTVFTLDDNGDVLVNGTYGTGCGTQGGGTSPPSFSPLSPAAADLTIPGNSLQSTGGTVNPNFVAYYATSCTGSVTPSSGCTAVTGNWAGGTVCTGQTNGAGQTYCTPASAAVTIPSNASTTAACTYAFKATCSGTGQPVSSQTVNVTVAASGSPPGNCTDGDTSGDQPGFTRQCSGNLSDDAVPPRNGTWTDFTSVYGTWPGSSANAGKTQKLTINKNSYAALAFTPGTAGTDNWTSNETYMKNGGMMSVSTAPGYFNSTSPQTVCVKTASGYNVSTISGLCKLTIGTTYYLNFATIDTTGAAICPTSSCVSAWTFQRVQ